MLLSASIASAQSDDLSGRYITHDTLDTSPQPEARFNEIDGVEFVNPFGGVDLPPEGERITVIPSEMSPVGRLIGISENGEKQYLCALTAITPPEPFKVSGNGHDIAVTAGHCIPHDGIEGVGKYVAYEGLFTGSDGQQFTVSIADIHHHQTNQDINLTHITPEVKDTLPARLHLLESVFYTRLFDTALVQFAEPLPETVDQFNVALNVLNDLTDDNSTDYYGYPRNTRGLTTDPESIIGPVKGTVFASDAFTNNGSSGGIFLHNGYAVGVTHGGFGHGEAGEFMSSHFNLSLSEHFRTVVPRIDYAGAYVNAPFLEINDSGLDTVSVRAGTKTNLLPSAETIVPGKKPIIEDENREYQVLDRQNGFVGILIEDPETRVFTEENLFYVPEDSVISPETHAISTTAKENVQDISPLPPPPKL